MQTLPMVWQISHQKGSLQKPTYDSFNILQLDEKYQLVYVLRKALVFYQ